MYEVRWIHPAFTDLSEKVRTSAVRRYLVAVGRVGLDRASPEWNGRLDNGLRWRRGILPEHEDDPDEVVGGPVDGGWEMPYDFVLVHVRASAATALSPRSLRVLAVLTNAELVAGPLFADGRAAYWAEPAAADRGRRLIRPRGGGADRR